jgi:hypothetical protein
VRVRASLHAEVRGVAHQHGAAVARVVHGRGKPGGSASGSRPPSCSRWDWGVVQ